MYRAHGNLPMDVDERMGRPSSSILRTVTGHAHRFRPSLCNRMLRGPEFHRGHDLELRLFRPDCNTQRTLNSATRVSSPDFDPHELQEPIESLIAANGEKWPPKRRPDTFVYLRPMMIATAAALEVQKPKEALLYIIACCFPGLDTLSGTAGPSSNITQHSPKARPGLRLLASKEGTVRAWPGGFRYAKVEANYGPSLIA